MSDSYSISQREFRRILRRVNKDTPLTLDRLLTVIACAGKPLHSSVLIQAWNALGKDTVTVDEAYKLYSRYEVTPIPGYLSDGQRDHFKGCKAQALIECVTNAFPEMHEAVVYEVERFTLANGDLNVDGLMRIMEATRKEAILTLAAPVGKVSPTPIGQQEYEPVEKSSGIRGMLIISPPLITTTYTIKLPEKCKAKVHMKLALNSNSMVDKSTGENRFANDLFLLVRDKLGNYVGVTKEITEQGFSTDELTLENDCTMVVLSLGTTEKKTPGTVANRRIVNETTGKVTKEFKVALLNIFDMFDLDGDGFLSMDEYNAYSLASGDSPVSEEDWRKMKKMVNFHDDRLTLSGFYEFHMLELSRYDEATLQDCWASLLQMGFDHELKLVNSTPFTIDVQCEGGISPIIVPKLTTVNKDMRDSMLSQFYRLGIVDKDCELEPRTFSTSYFGLTIVDRIRALDNAGYRVVVEKEHNIKWHYICGKNNIKPFTFESELVLICTWVATAKDHIVDFHLEREEEPKKEPLPRLSKASTKQSELA